MNKIGQGIAKIQLKTRGACISAVRVPTEYIRCGEVILVSRRRKVSIFNSMQM
jgi:hypothetical protein